MRYNFGTGQKEVNGLRSNELLMKKVHLHLSL